MFILIAAPTLVGGGLNYYNTYSHAHNMCPKSKTADLTGHELDGRIHYESASRVSRYTSVRCNFTAYVPKALAERVNRMGPNESFPKDIADELDKLEESGRALVTGPTTGSLPTIWDALRIPLLLGGAAFGIYIVFFLIVWGLVWVWRGPRKEA
jgi:hypothetical protein